MPGSSLSAWSPRPWPPRTGTCRTTAPGWTLATYFEPHNEHPAILLRAAYSALLHTVGLRAYWPYMAVLVLAHMTNVLLLFELVRRRSGELIALGAALLLLLL